MDTFQYFTEELCRTRVTSQLTRTLKLRLRNGGIITVMRITAVTARDWKCLGM